MSEDRFVSPLTSGTYRVRGRVLVVDDEPLLATAVQRGLSHDNDVVVVSDADSALRRLRAGERYDVILCDVMMPVIDGIELHRLLSATHPAEAERIVFISGGARTTRVESFFQRAPNLLLEKPVDLAALRTLVRERARCGRAEAAARVAAERGEDRDATG